MKPLLIRFLATVTVAVPLIALASVDQARERSRPAAKASLTDAYGQLPLQFEANGGRTDKRVDFIARGRGYSLFLTPAESVLSLVRGGKTGVVRVGLDGAATGRGRGEQTLPGRVNSLIGNDPSKWRTGIPTYGRVRYGSVYPGIDLIYYGNAGRLEYDFVVAPGADPSRIGLNLSGASSIRVDRRGDLVLSTPAGAVRQHRPVAYQVIDGRRSPVQASYALDGRRVAIELGNYDPNRELVIDPILSYSSFLGGGQADFGTGVAVDNAGNAYVTGYTTSTNFPVAGGFRSSPSGTDAFVTKINASGSAIVYSTYVGGTGSDYARAITVSGGGTAFITGQTSSTNFPVPNAVDATYGNTGTNGGNDAFAAAISSSGSSIIWGTYIGGTLDEDAHGIAYVPASNVFSPYFVHIAGETQSSTSFVQDGDAYDGSANGLTDGFVYSLAYSSAILGDATLSRYYSTFIGGSGTDIATGIDTDDSGKAYISGYTNSNDVAVKGTGADSDPDNATGNNYDGFVAKFDTGNGTPANTLVYLTYLGGSGNDKLNGIAVTGAGTAHVAGQTTTPRGNVSAPPDLPGMLTDSVLNHSPQNASDDDGFVSQVAATSATPPTVVAGATSYIGGDADDFARGIAVYEGATNTSQYIVGETKSDSTTFQGRNSISGATVGDPQAFVLKRYTGANPDAIWVSYLGGNSNEGDFGEGIAVDGLGRAYITGYGGFDFPLAHPVQGTYGNGAPAGGSTSDAIVARIDQVPPNITGGPADGAVLGTKDVSFSFSAPEAGLAFKCSSLDNTTKRLTTTLATCAPPTKSYTGLADGKHTFQVVTVDDASDTSDPAAAQRTFYVDVSSPPAFDLNEPANGAQTDTNPTFKWQQSHDTGTAVTYHLILDGVDVKQVDESACASDVCSMTLDTPLVTGAHNWIIRAVDVPGHSVDSTSNFSFTAISPPAAAFTIAPNPVLVGGNVTFDASATADAAHTIVKYEWDLDGDGSYETDSGTSPTTKRVYLNAGDVNVSLKATDSTGTSGTATNALKVTTVSGITFLGVTINNGAQYTKSPAVTVTATYPGAITQMVFSNDGGFLAPAVFTPQKDTAWKLDSSGPERLPKTIYVRFFTGPFPSETYQDDIILDETPPKVTAASVSAGASASSAGVAVASKTKKWKAKLKASDSNSGVQYVQLTSNKKKPGKLLKYKKKLTVKSAKKPKWVRARDRAGNYSKWRKAR